MPLDAGAAWSLHIEDRSKTGLEEGQMRLHDVGRTTRGVLVCVIVGVTAALALPAEGARPRPKRLPTPTMTIQGTASRAGATRLVIRVRGTVRAPAGVAASAACRGGSMVVQATAVGRLLATRAARWTSLCRFALTLRLTGDAATGLRKLVVTAHFSGTTTVGATRTRATLTIH